jgi:hypothetical protein
MDLTERVSTVPFLRYKSPLLTTTVMIVIERVSTVPFLRYKSPLLTTTVTIVTERVSTVPIIFFIHIYSCS